MAAEFVARVNIADVNLDRGALPRSNASRIAIDSNT